jgi:hypothetical protein
MSIIRNTADIYNEYNRVVIRLEGKKVDRLRIFLENELEVDYDHRDWETFKVTDDLTWTMNSKVVIFLQKGMKVEISL